MATQGSPVFITGMQRRQELIAAFPTDMEFNTKLRAVLWFGDISAVEKIVSDCRNDAMGQRSWFLKAHQIIDCWMQRGPSLRSSTPSPSSDSIRLTKERDANRCLITLQTPAQVAHIYPFCLTDNPAQAVDWFWVSLLSVFPGSTNRWYEALFSRGIYKDSCRNLFSLAADPRVYHARGSFGLKPISKAPDNTQLQVEFHWFHLNPAYARNHNYAAVPQLYHPNHNRAPNPVGSGTDLLLDHTTYRWVSSGDVLTMQTPDAERLPLPDFDVLEMQWRIQMLVAASYEEPPDAGDVGDEAYQYSLDPTELEERLEYAAARDSEYDSF